MGALQTLMGGAAGQARIAVFSSSLIPGSSPGGQGASFLGYSSNPVVGSLQSPAIKGQNCLFISEWQGTGTPYIQIGITTPLLLPTFITGCEYGPSKSIAQYAAPTYSGGQTIWAFTINQKSLASGSPITFKLFDT